MEMEDDFIVKALRLMVDEIRMRSLVPNTGAMARLIDETAVQLTAYMIGREETFRKEKEKS